MFTVALVGRPNVGKSTLFNRMVKKQLAIIYDEPGVTRDWREAEAKVGDYNTERKIRLIDTAGYDDAPNNSLTGRMRNHTDDAIEKADLIIFVLDGRSEITAVDEWTAARLRRANLPIIPVLNKAENENALECEAEVLAFGFGEPLLVSSAHGQGFYELDEKIIEYMPEQNAESQNDDEDEDTKPIKIAIIGQPNAGKSTLMNALLGTNRSLTGPEAGLTRDSVHAKWEYNGQLYELVDTAGLRRKNRVDGILEDFSVEDSLRAIRLAQIVVLVIDRSLTTEHQDITLAGLVIKEGRALVVAMNKMDLKAPDESAMAFIKGKTLENSINEVPDLPMVNMIATRGKGLKPLMKAVETTYETWNKRVGTGALNRWLDYVKNHNPPPMVANRPNSIKYVSQINNRPPTFAMWCSKPNDIPDSYKRYLIRSLREDLDIHGVPIRLLFRGKKNPYAHLAKRN